MKKSFAWCTAPAGRKSVARGVSPWEAHSDTTLSPEGAAETSAAIFRPFGA
jgi:hypothetical protein